MSPERWLSIGLWLLAIVLAGLTTVFPAFLILLGAAAAVCLVVGGVLWLRGRKTSPKTTVAAGSTDEFRFDAPPQADLAIFMDREEFHPFQYMAMLLEAKFRIENLTDKTKHLMGTTWAMDPPKDGDLSGTHNIEVIRAVHELQEKRPPPLHGTIAPRDTVSGWVHVALPHQPWGGVGGYTVTMEDEVGTQYVLRRERRGGRESLA